MADKKRNEAFPNRVRVILISSQSIDNEINK